SLSLYETAPVRLSTLSLHDALPISLALLGVGLTHRPPPQFAQRTHEQRDDRRRTRRVEPHPRRIEQRDVAGPAVQHRVHPGEEAVPVLRPSSAVAPLDKRQPVDAGPRPLEL